MGILIVLIIVFGTVVSIFISSLAFVRGKEARENEVRWSILYGNDCYDNPYILPFNILYDLGYASYDKVNDRSQRNKEMFNRKR